MNFSMKVILHKKLRKHRVSANSGKSGKSGNSLYPLKSQGKVREFSEKSGKSQGKVREFLVTSRNLFLGTAN